MVKQETFIGITSNDKTKLLKLTSRYRAQNVIPADAEVISI
jgi:hypothetical protein